MKAAVIIEPGKIEVQEVEKPKAGPGEVLLKVNACAICGTDQRVLAGTKAVDVPIVGHEISGIALEIGEGVTNVEKGKRYIVQTVIGCGECAACKREEHNLCEKGFTAIGYQYNGGFAEYIVMPEVAVKQGCLIEIPDSLSDLDATMIEPLSCCVNGMKYIPVEDMENVVIFGGGIIGVLNGLVCRARGAKNITIMDVSQDRLDLLKNELKVPFQHFVNSAETDPVEWAMELTGGVGVNAVVVAASVKPLVAVGLKMLGKGGHLSVFAGMPKPDSEFPIDLNLIHYGEIDVHGANSSARSEYLEARDLIVSGKIDPTPLITHRFKLDDFNDGAATQADPSTGALKVVIEP